MSNGVFVSRNWLLKRGAIFDILGFVKLSLCLIKHYGMNVHGGVDV
jgi:hypothetical protein